MRVVTDYATEGSNSSNISDMWLYVNDNLQGIYQLPARVPILAEGPTRLSFNGGILLNGVSSTRTEYPYYVDTTIEADLVPTETDTFIPVVSYRNATQFLLLEDFENGNEFTNVIRQVNTDDVFQGNVSGRINTDTSRTVNASTSNFFNVPFFGGTVFVELDYKNTHTLNAGIRLISPAGNLQLTKVSMPPRENWTKIYLNFTPEILDVQATNIQIFFSVDGSTDNEPVEVFLDNVKILYL